MSTPKHERRGFLRRHRLAAVGLTSVAAVLVAAGTALAAISATPIATTNGTAGYGALAPAGQTFSNLQATVTANQYGTTIQGGVIGIQLSTAPVAGVCNAAQAGLVANTASSSYQVDYGLGSVGTVASPCPVGGVIAAADRHAFTGLGAVANTDDVWVSINVGENCKIRHGDRRHHDERWGHQRCRGHHHGKNVLTFLAQDLTTNSPVVSAQIVDTSNDHFTNAAAGTEEDTTKLTPCAVQAIATTAFVPVAYQAATCQVVADVSYVSATVDGALPQALDTLSATMAYADASAGANSAANPAVVDTHNSYSLGDHGPSGPASFGAVSSGGDFNLFTANSIG